MSSVVPSVFENECAIAITFEHEAEFQSSKSKRQAEEELVATAAAVDTWSTVAHSGIRMLRRGRGRPRGRSSLGASGRGLRGRPRGRPRYNHMSSDTNLKLLSSTAYLSDYPSLIPQDAEHELDQQEAELNQTISKGCRVKTRIRQCAVRDCNNSCDGSPLGDIFGFYEMKDSIDRLAHEVEPRFCTQHTLVSRDLHAKRRTMVGRKWKENLAWQSCCRCEARVLVWCSIEPISGCFNHCARVEKELVRVSCHLLAQTAVLKDDIIFKRQLDTLKHNLSFICVACFAKNYPSISESTFTHVEKAAAPLPAAVTEAPSNDYRIDLDDEVLESSVMPPLVPPSAVRLQYGTDLCGVCKPLLLKDFVVIHKCKMALADLAPWSVSKRGSVLEFLLPIEDTLRVFVFDEADMTFCVLVAERLVECGTLALFSRHLCVPVKHVLQRLEQLANCHGVLSQSVVSMTRTMAAWSSEQLARCQVHFEEDTGRQVVRSRQCKRLRERLREADTLLGRMTCSSCWSLQEELHLPQDARVLVSTKDEVEAVSAVQHEACFDEKESMIISLPIDDAAEHEMLSRDSLSAEVLVETHELCESVDEQSEFVNFI